MTNAKLKIKYIKATGKDAEGFFELFSETVRKYFPEYSPNTRKHFLLKEYSLPAIKAQLKTGEIELYLAINEQQIVGYLMTRPITGGVILGCWLAVKQEHQGCGIASALLRIWEKDAKKQGFHKLHLWTDKRNLKFYKNRGFIFVGKIPQNYYGADDYLFYKTLQAPKEKNFLK